MEKTDTMTFLAGTPAEYKTAYPGLKELLSNTENAPSFWAEKEVTAAKEAGLVPALVDDPAYQDSTTREQFAQLIVQLITVATGKEMEAPRPIHSRTPTAKRCTRLTRPASSMAWATAPLLPSRP